MGAPTTDKGTSTSDKEAPTADKGALTTRADQNTTDNNTIIDNGNKKPKNFDSKYHRIALGDITPNNLGQLKRLNSVLFPVNYSEKFYKDILEVGEFAKFAYFNDACVGAVCCRKEPIDGGTTTTSIDQSKLYIMTLGVLAPYRKLGLGSKLLQHILNHATSINNNNQNQQQQSTPSSKTFTEIYLHVQISNEEALNFYKKYKFEIIGVEENYYKKISPANAYILSKKL